MGQKGTFIMYNVKIVEKIGKVQDLKDILLFNTLKWVKLKKINA
jgi:hypothetical protein